MNYSSIPEPVIEKIIAHRPHLAGIARNLAGAKFALLARQYEKALANGYLQGETRLSIAETWKLSSCCVGRRYGE